VADVMRDHYEGTPMDMTTDIGAGGNGLPYRWRPMNFTVDGKTYLNERAIATQQTGFWFVAQARPNLPDEVGALIWFGCDDAATSYLTPIYANLTEVPECLRVGNGDMLTYSPTSQFWMCNRIANACYKMYDRMAPVVRAEADRFERDQLERAIPEMDAKLVRLVEKGRIRKARRLMTKYSVETAQAQFAVWTKLEELLLVKFIDGNIKAQGPDGAFLRTAANTVAEDCADMSAIQFRMDIFKAFTEGYLQSARSFLLPVEIENLPYATALFPYMQCVRFLWDYLSGDKYWKCQYPEHNFVRANNQLHLLLSIEAHEAEMKDFIGKIIMKS